MGDKASGWPLGEDVGWLTSDGPGVVALSKPAGTLSHPNEPGDEDRALLQARFHTPGEYYRWTSEGRERRAWLLNRLDSATSGVLLLATDEALALHIRGLFQQREIHKVYNALVFGVPHASQQHWRDMLAIEKKGGQIRTRAQGNIPSEAMMRVLRQWRGQPSLALLELTPKTGRSHQLRVQCAHRHLPIVGDATYGDFPANRAWAKQTGLKRLFLHSLRTQFDYEWKGRGWSFKAEAPLPKEFVTAAS